MLSMKGWFGAARSRGPRQCGGTREPPPARNTHSRHAGRRAPSAAGRASPAWIRRRQERLARPRRALWACPGRTCRLPRPAALRALRFALAISGLVAAKLGPAGNPVNPGRISIVARCRSNCHRPPAIGAVKFCDRPCGEDRQPARPDPGRAVSCCRTLASCLPATDATPADRE